MLSKSRVHRQCPRESVIFGQWVDRAGQTDYPRGQSAFLARSQREPHMKSVYAHRKMANWAPGHRINFLVCCPYSWFWGLHQWHQSWQVRPYVLLPWDVSRSPQSPITARVMADASFHGQSMKFLHSTLDLTYNLKSYDWPSFMTMVYGRPPGLCLAMMSHSEGKYDLAP